MIMPVTGYRAYVLRNTNRLLGRIPGVEGVKTGFTSKAGRCVIAKASQNETDLLLVILNSNRRWKEYRKEPDRLRLPSDQYHSLSAPCLTRRSDEDPLLSEQFRLDGCKATATPGMVHCLSDLAWSMKDRREGLVGLGKLDIDVLAQIIHLEALFVIGEYRAHNIFVAVLFLSEQLPNLFGAFAVKNVPKDTSRFESESIVDKKQIDLAVLDSDSSHRPGWFPLVEKEDERGLLFHPNSRNMLFHQGFDRLVF